MSNNALDFTGRVALVTGAGAGLGRAHALELARRGTAVVVNDLAFEAAEAVVKEITAVGGQAIADSNSVATPEGGAAMVNAAISEFDGLDIVVNNAGLVRDKTFAKMTPELLDPVLDVHLKGAFYVSQPAYAHMKEAGYGRLVFTSSAAGLFGNFGQTSYGAAKMGLVGLTRVLALEGAKYGIHSNAIAPIAATAMSAGLLDEEWERRLRPELVSPAVVWLAHERCPSNGGVYSVAAGRIAKVFIAETRGFYSPELAAEDIEANWEQICAEKGYAVPASAEGERDVLAQWLDLPVA
jgi:NAD(P)-dependent dehydrogenase (short-subunit alcohol dehydrogenase family)